MGRRAKLTAHHLVRPAVEGFLERVEAAADRVIADNAGGSTQVDDEAVHDFRVALRRLRTIFRASRTLYGKKQVKRLEGLAKSFGDATSALRDAEVLEDTLNAAILDNRGREAGAAWLAEVRAQEAGLREEAITLIKGDGLGKLIGDSRRLLTEGANRDAFVIDYAEGCFDEVRGGVRELLPAAHDDVDRLHRLRIRFKRLRYTTEMLAQFMAVVDATGSKKKQRRRAQQLAMRYGDVARSATRMQKQLGLLHDADQALDALATSGLDPAQREAIAPALIDLRRRLVGTALTQLASLPKRIVGKGPVVITAEISLPVRA